MFSTCYTLLIFLNLVLHYINLHFYCTALWKITLTTAKMCKTITVRYNTSVYFSCYNVELTISRKGALSLMSMRWMNTGVVTARGESGCGTPSLSVALISSCQTSLPLGGSRSRGCTTYDTSNKCVHINNGTHSCEKPHFQLFQVHQQIKFRANK